MAERDDTIAEILVGAAVLAAAVGFFAYASSTAGGAFRAAEGYELTASFRSAEGVSLGTEVRMAGVRIGTVTAMALNPATFRADTTFSVAGDLEIPDDSAAAIASEGLLGGTFVEIIPGGSPFVLEPGGEILDTQSSVSLITLLMRFAAGDDGS
ncbi:outer membrane lipid asymmetry maintenance protein MlaD [Roseibacterium sp. SDUM158017]|uniref:outer membrane lipid asymmetry maintenance protein MlaD n=1 Tax=Roseicyclus salinarum TaxID=3036773 RepID=UPI0024156F40|nr:outer membrane lipid asymmetry maintenance protein MlaD [Roseibacterium sp. SDUM158017]MDG4648163.1 outer membrane lipid asymmetry maintenance protein MlaD [Roseibacterium sp. SDUM158017]